MVVNVIVHTYKSTILPLSVKSFLKLDPSVVKGTIVFCRWKEFADLGEDKNISLLADFLSNDEWNRLQFIYHESGTHSQWECRTEVMNTFIDEPRMWLDSDQMLYGRFNHLEFVEPMTQYYVQHMSPVLTGLMPHQIMIPYIFGVGVEIWYEGNNFLTLNSNAKRTEDWLDLYTMNMNALESDEYLNGRKAWSQMMAESTMKSAGTLVRRLSE